MASQNRILRRVALASGIGTCLEYYDFYLYGALSATVFGKLFFPSNDPTVGTLLAFVTFGVGFVARPLGGIIAGHYGDRVGRKAVLIGTLALMGLSTVGIGLLPTYATLGTAAPVLLVALRLVQGLAHGGEWGGAVIMTVEHAPTSRRAFFGTWPQMGVYVGIVLSNLLLNAFLTLPKDTFLAWGWRMPFLLGAILVVTGLYLRGRITESPEFADLKAKSEQARVPVVEALRTSPRAIAVSFGAKIAETCLFYLITVFALSYAQSAAKISQGYALNGVLVASLLATVTVGAFGVLSDRIGRRSVYAFGSAFSAVFAFPFFWMTQTGSVAMLWLALIAGLAIGHAAMYGAQSYYLAELFDARVRYSGASLGYQLGAALVGGFTPLIAASLLLTSHGKPWPVAWYVIACGLITTLVVAVWGKVQTGGSTHTTTNSLVASSE